MSLWTEITNTALIGCERKSPSLHGAADKVGVLLAQLDQNDREGALLGAAALVSLYDRAGTLPLKDTPPLPEACEPGDAPRCGERAAAWIEGFLKGSGLLLLHDEALWRTLDEWLTALPNDSFTALAPLLRRTFSTFTSPERRQIGERARRGAPDASRAAIGAQPRAEAFDQARAETVLPLIAKLLGTARDAA